MSDRARTRNPCGRRAAWAALGAKLMLAALDADADLMRALIERGADVKAVDRAGASALIWSAGDPAKVRLLLERGAEVNATAGPGGATALLVAAGIPGNLEAVRLLIDRGRTRMRPQEGSRSS